MLLKWFSMIEEGTRRSTQFVVCVVNHNALQLLEKPEHHMSIRSLYYVMVNLSSSKCVWCLFVFIGWNTDRRRHTSIHKPFGGTFHTRQGEGGKLPAWRWWRDETFGVGDCCSFQNKEEEGNEERPFNGTGSNCVPDGSTKRQKQEPPLLDNPTILAWPLFMCVLLFLLVFMSIISFRVVRTRLILTLFSTLLWFVWRLQGRTSSIGWFRGGKPEKERMTLIWNGPLNIPNFNNQPSVVFLLTFLVSRVGFMDWQHGRGPSVRRRSDDVSSLCAA